jgi:hypothetical protein
MTDARLFVGRDKELQVITGGMTAMPPVSINVVGRRRIGKSSLLYHFFQTWEQRVEEQLRYVVVYISLQEVRCQSEEDFYHAIGRQLWSRPLVQAQPALSDPLRTKPFNRLAFSSALGYWKRQGVLPTICLDEFECLVRSPQVFNDDFFNSLRSLLDSGALMLIVASLRELAFYRRRHGLTSSFFKMGRVLPLEELREEAAKELVRLPASKIPETQPALSMEEQTFARQLGGRHPYLLQLAGLLLWEAQQLGKDSNWVRARFEREAQQVPGYSFNPRRWGGLVQVLAWLPLHLGRMVRGVGGTADEIGNLIVGMSILIAVIFVLLGVLNWELLQNLLEGIFQLE